MYRSYMYNLKNFVFQRKDLYQHHFNQDISSNPDISIRYAPHPRNFPAPLSRHSPPTISNHPSSFCHYGFILPGLELHVN